MSDLARDCWVKVLEDEACAVTLCGESRKAICALLKEKPQVDHLTPETLWELDKACGTVSGDLRGLRRIIDRLSPPPVVTWTDVGDGSIAACGGWTLMVRSSTYGDDRYTWSVTCLKKEGACNADDKTKASAKSAAEAKLAELMRGA